MPNYQNGKIYEIICLTTGLRYIGSTTEKYLSRRLATHVRDSKKKKHPCTSSQIISGGNYKINLLLAYPCNNIDELNTKEYEFMKNIECINKIKGLGRNKDTVRAYKIRCKDAINETRRKWRLKKKLEKKIPSVWFEHTTSEL